MKRLSAIVLSLLLFWVQVVLMAQPQRAEALSQCCGCACKKAHCCVTQSSPDPAPLPAATIPIGPQNPDSFSVASAVAWLLPRGEQVLPSAGDLLSLLASRIPLFRRDCALLI